MRDEILRVISRPIPSELAEVPEARIDEELETARQLSKEGSYEKSFELYQSLANDGQVIAQTAVGLCKMVGLGTEQSVDNGKDWLTKSAIAGDVLAEYYLGKIFFEKSEYEKCQKWFARAAHHNFYPAFYCLGVLSEFELADPVGKREAIKMYETAITNGHIYSCLALGRLYLRGIGGIGKLPRGIFLTVKGFVLAAYVGAKNPHSMRLQI